MRGLSWEEIQAHRDGLICLSGGRQGWIERYLRAGDLAAAQVYAGRLAGAFDDQAYLSLEIRAEADRPIALEVAALGRRLGMPAVAVQPIYCLAPEDAPRLRLLAAIRENRPLGNPAAQEEEAGETELELDERAAGAKRPDFSPEDGAGLRPGGLVATHFKRLRRSDADGGG